MPFLQEFQWLIFEYFFVLGICHFITAWASVGIYIRTSTCRLLAQLHKFLPSKLLNGPDISYPIFTLTSPCTCTCCIPQLIKNICSVATGSSFWAESKALPVFVYVFSVVLICPFEGHLLCLASAIQLLLFLHVPLLTCHFVG